MHSCCLHSALLPISFVSSQTLFDSTEGVRPLAGMICLSFCVLSHLFVRELILRSVLCSTGRTVEIGCSARRPGATHLKPSWLSAARSGPTCLANWHSWPSVAYSATKARARSDYWPFVFDFDRIFDLKYSSQRSTGLGCSGRSRRRVIF